MLTYSSHSYRFLRLPIFAWLLVLLFCGIFLPGRLPAAEKKLTALDGSGEDYFGYSVSVSGEYAILGAYQDDDHGSSSGSAYIYSRNEGGINNWGPLVKLTALDAAAGDYFGWSVSISGDYAIVGAYQDDDHGSSSGSAYIFFRNQGGANNWGQLAKLTALDAASHDYFGYSVSISGDDAIVGASSDDDDGDRSGSAYIFSRNQGGANNWGQIAKLTALDAAEKDFFGISVSISGDDAIVGAYLDDDHGSNSGSAYIFSRNQGGANNWGQLAKLTALDAAAGDYFGWSVSISGDDAIAGASYDDYDNGSNNGSAYIFSRNQGGANNWGQSAKLIPLDASGDLFGRSVAISGDYAMIGAYLDDDNGVEAGAAYFFLRDGASWNQFEKITASDGEAYDYYGYSVSISGNYAIAGAYWDDDNGANAGAGYLYEVVEEPHSLPGAISGTVSVDGSGLAGVQVTLLDTSGNAAAGLDTLITDNLGRYSFIDVLPDTYLVSIFEPLGYSTEENPIADTLTSGAADTVDFILELTVMDNNARGAFYWTRQFRKNVRGRGHPRESEQDLLNYINEVHEHYTPHFDVFANDTTLVDWLRKLRLWCNFSQYKRARRQLAALVMNIVSEKVGQYTVVTADGRTAGDVLTYVSSLATDGDPGNDRLAKRLARKVNRRRTIAAGIIPAGNILYKGSPKLPDIDWGFGAPEAYKLSQNYPNPFNPTTTIGFLLPTSGQVKLTVYDLVGRQIAALVNGKLTAGRHEVVWDARDFPSGPYFYRLKTIQFAETKRMMLLR